MEGGTLGGIERAVKEEVFASFRFCTACAHELFRFEVSLVCAKVASASLEPSEEG